MRTVVGRVQHDRVVGHIDSRLFSFGGNWRCRVLREHRDKRLHIVLKLFCVVDPNRAYFGQKDAQQVEVIRRMIRDLALEVELRVVPTVRDADGLALSSRNVLLSSEQRARALALSRALALRDRDAALEELRASNGLAVDYVEVADFDPPVLAGAIRVGSTRLIDNVPLEGDET